MTTKHYTIRYYRIQAHRDGKEYDLSLLFDGIVQKSIITRALSLLDQGSDYQLRGVSLKDGKYSGHLVRFRDDRPIAGSRNHDEEKPVELAEGEEVIDKNHFAFYKKGSAFVLAYQSTMEGGSAQALGRYLAGIADRQTTIMVADLVTEETLDALLQGKRVQYVEFKVAKPTAKKYMPDPEDTWTQQAIEFMDNSGATRFQAKVVTYSPKKGLLTDIVPKLRLLAESKQTKKLKIKVSDQSDPIDLFADRIKDKISVEMDNGVISSAVVHDEIWRSTLRMDIKLSKFLDE
ncbi:MAG TPA: hypothetical protein ENH72_09695 [Pseudomonas sabulinigri]|uniref:Uncharacterized protein n=1 Tax=marine sediment metagenome TaxID=412755 RepID=A0A0F9VIZ1_9ZZZZ|nr:hypothetical protein [Halopseudomonas sabulinigri]HEC50824.1 hypothetical protein [Halopseudomonas sabulinigri]